MNAFFVSVRILWTGYDPSSRSRRTNALASLAPRRASRALTPWWVQRKAKTGESTTVPGLSFFMTEEAQLLNRRNNPHCHLHFDGAWSLF